MRPRSCRQCGTPVLTVHETGVRVALAAVIDARPLDVFAPLDPGLIWENHPKLGWMSRDIPRRRGFPLHRLHQCKRKTQAQDRKGTP